MARITHSLKGLLALGSIAVGIVLAVFFWDLRIWWFQGGFLGVALIGLGVLDLWESGRRKKPSRSLLEELRDEVVGPPHRSKSRHIEPPTGPDMRMVSTKEEPGVDGMDSSNPR